MGTAIKGVPGGAVPLGQAQYLFVATVGGYLASCSRHGFSYMVP
jgi:hypothetical protein